MAIVSLYLPKKTQLSIKEGDSVVYGQTLAQDTTAEIGFSVSSLLGIKPGEYTKVIVVKEGDYVQKGDLLAKKSGMFGTKKAVATFQGQVTRIDWERGEIHVSPNLVDHVTIVSPVDGKVKKIADDEIAIDFTGAIFFAKQGIGKMAKGQLAVISQKDDEVLLNNIRQDHHQKVLLGGYFPRQVLEKACGIDVAAVLSTNIHGTDFTFFEEHTMFPITLVLIAKADYDEIASFEKRDVVVEGMHKRIIINEGNRN